MPCASLRALMLPLAVLAAATALPWGRAAAQALLPRASVPDPVVDAARQAFEALPEADRKAIQDSLIWTGDYSGIADGTFGRQTFVAVAAYQDRTRQPANGVLTSQARSALQAAAQQARTTAGFTLIDDPKTGLRIGVPAKLLPKQDVNPSGGSRWQSADGKVTLDTRTAPPDATLQSLYDRNLAIQTPGRVVSYKVLRPDFFVIAGETPAGKFYTRYSSGPAGLRGFSIGYDKAVAPQVDRLVVAIANSFTPFPAAPTVAAAPQNAAPAPVQQPQAQPPAQKLVATGLVVSRRQVVTAAPLSSCPVLSVAGVKPQKVTGQGLLVLDFGEDLKAQPYAPAIANANEGSALLVVAFADENGSPRLSVAPGSAAGMGRVTAPLQPGASGAPVLDMSGALVGLVGTVSGDQRKVAGIVPATGYPMVPAAGIAKAAPALAQQQTAPAAQKRSAADIVAALRPSLVPIVCGP